MASRGLRPGAIAPVSGEYRIVGVRGGRTNVERTVKKGQRLPPTRRTGETYQVARRAHNGWGKGPVA
jgi:hypothetical protein